MDRVLQFLCTTSKVSDEMDPTYLSILRGKENPLEKTYKERSLHRIFEANAERHPNNTALLYEEQGEGFQTTETYAELNATSNQLARALLHHLSSAPVPNQNSEGDNIIALSLSPRPALVQVLLALWKAGAAYLPLDVTAPEQRVRHILDESKPLLIISESDTAQDNPAYKGRTVLSLAQLTQLAQSMPSDNVPDEAKLRPGNNNIQSSDIAIVLYTSAQDNPAYKGRTVLSLAQLTQLAQSMPSDNVPDEAKLRPGNNNIQSSDIAIVLYTSGSTGIPKGVRLPHPVILNRLVWQWATFPYSPSEAVGAFKTALTFVDAVSEIWGPLLSPQGGGVLIVPREVTKNPELLIASLEKYRIERLVLVPSLLRSILMFLKINGGNQTNTIPLSHLKLWVCSGETLSKSLCFEFFEHFDQHGSRIPTRSLCNFYGSTEVMGDVTFYEMRGVKDVARYEKIPIGKVIDNTHIFLLDAHQKPVPIGEVGEIYACGHNIAAGYVNGRDPDRFINNDFTTDRDYRRMYKTGDFGRIVDSILLYEGRTDSQVKIRGNRVDLSEIESALTKLSEVDKLIVLCYRPGEVDQALLAFVTLQPETSHITSFDIEARLSEHLNPYSIPQVIIKDSIPLLVNGKIDRQSLLRGYAAKSADSANEAVHIDYTGIPPDQLPLARVLFETVQQVLGPSARAHLSPQANFYQIGGNSLNSIYTITKLRQAGYTVAITEFISAQNFGEIIDRITPLSESQSELSASLSSKYQCVFLAPEHKQDLFSIITDSFYEKADLERWIIPELQRDCYVELLEQIWEPLMAARLSFIVRARAEGEEGGKILGACLNFDALEEPEVTISSKLNIVFEFLEHVEGPIRNNQLPKDKGSILHSFMMGTEKSLNAKDNVEIITAMEAEILRIAKDRQFQGILTTNTNPLTQQLGTDVFNYQVLLDYPVNKFVTADGNRPFGEAEDSQRAMVCWKPVAS